MRIWWNAIPEEVDLHVEKFFGAEVLSPHNPRSALTLLCHAVRREVLHIPKPVLVLNMTGYAGPVLAEYMNLAAEEVKTSIGRVVFHGFVPPPKGAQGGRLLQYLRYMVEQDLDSTLRISDTNPQSSELV